jgi:hypothetical protein
MNAIFFEKFSPRSAATSGSSTSDKMYQTLVPFFICPRYNGHRDRSVDQIDWSRLKQLNRANQALIGRRRRGSEIRKIERRANRWRSRKQVATRPRAKRSRTGALCHVGVRVCSRGRDISGISPLCDGFTRARQAAQRDPKPGVVQHRGIRRRAIHGACRTSPKALAYRRPLQASVPMLTPWYLKCT